MMRVKRRLFLGLVWVLGVGACVCVAGEIAALFGHGFQWEYRSRTKSGLRRTFFGIGHEVGVSRNLYPELIPLPGETEVGGGVGGDASRVDFGVGIWRHVYKCTFYSPVANDTYDPQKVSGYRKVVYVDAKIFALRGWFCALLLGLLPAVAVVRAWRRFMAWTARRRAKLLGRCWNCGYDLRATPERCPECGVLA